MKGRTVVTRIWRLSRGQVAVEEDRLAVEVGVVVVAGGRRMDRTPASPGMELELGAGAVLTEGLMSWEENPPGVKWEAQAGQVRVLGRLGKVGWPPPVRKVKVVALALAASLTTRMQQMQQLFPATGAAHAAAFFDARARVLAMAEDISRHNALDKAAGQAWMKGVLGQAVAVAVSGRVSGQMLSKAAYTGTPIVVSVSAPTARAVELAVEAGITLVGFARPGRANIYSHPEQVGIGEEGDG